MASLLHIMLSIVKKGDTCFYFSSQNFNYFFLILHLFWYLIFDKTSFAFSIGTVLRRKFCMRLVYLLLYLMSLRSPFDCLQFVKLIVDIIHFSERNLCDVTSSLPELARFILVLAPLSKQFWLLVLSCFLLWYILLWLWLFEFLSMLPLRNVSILFLLNNWPEANFLDFVMHYLVHTLPCLAGHVLWHNWLVLFHRSPVGYLPLLFDVVELVLFHEVVKDVFRVENLRTLIILRFC